ncbi:MAG: glutamate--tRNA ligase [Actinobacteria bacterium]|nr:glutamate--tRNA ligase [Actinomycetota bacterium]
MTDGPRLRFSPAPTGYLHVGSARSALFNWLAARHAGGQLLLRVEDTNAELYKPEYLDSILVTLDWLGIGFDEEPVFQSQRADRYATATQELLDGGFAYYCDCTPEAVKERTAGNATPGYDGFCRDRKVAPGPNAAVRFNVPDEGTLAFDDIVRGRVEFELAALTDFVIQRANGTATFYLPNAVDDVDMGITHVVRGEDLINVTPNVLLIRQALGNDERPAFAHLPLIVNAQRKKLSKRRDDVSVEDFRARGYLPEAFRNYLAVLGWGPKDGVEVRPIEEIVEQFALEDVVSSPAFFDSQKLDHFNGEYIRALDTAEFTQRVDGWLPPEWDRSRFEKVAPLVQERIKKLDEAPEMVDFLFLSEVVIDDDSWQKAVAKLPQAAAVLDAALERYATVDWNAAALHELTAAIAEEHDLKLGKAQGPIRVAVTGRSVGPPLFESLEVLGRDVTLARLRTARERLG